MLNRTIAPTISMPKHLDLVHSKVFTLQNGLKIHYFSGCSEPVLSLKITNKGGKNFEKVPYASFMAEDMLKKGTATQPAHDIQEALDFLGASLSARNSLFNSTIQLSCLSEKIEAILPILVDILTQASFPVDELEILKNRHIQNLKVKQKKNDYLASVQFNQAIFGYTHSCGKCYSAEDIDALQREDIVAYYKTHFQLNTESTLILTGEVTESTLELINQYLGKVELNKIALESIKPFVPNEQKEYFSTKEKSVQCSLRVGMPLMLKANDKDFLDLDIVNRILGGFFGSRLMKNIREDKGYTYGIYSFITPFKNSSYFCIATDVGIAYRDNTLREISYEIERLQKELVSKEELDMVKNYHKGRIMKGIDGAFPMANKLSALLPLGLNEEYVNQQLEAVENITAERIKELANKYFNFEAMYKISVG